jgi:predicted acetyltransferase
MCLVYLGGITPITTAKQPAHVCVTPAAPEEESTITNLLELCAHDFSEFHQLELQANGRFDYKRLSGYWSEPERYPFLIKVDGRLAGLVLVKRGSEISGGQAVWDVGEFFIVRAYRRQGIGMNVAHHLWQRFPGRWEVRVMQANCTALKFWQHVITTFTGEAVRPDLFKKNGMCWHVFAFDYEQATRRH